MQMAEHSKFLFKSRKNHLYIRNGVLKVILSQLLKFTNHCHLNNLIKNLKIMIKKRENYECTSHIYPVRNMA